MKSHITPEIRQSINDLKNFIRGNVPAGYTVVLIMNDGEIICRDCAKKNYKIILESTRLQLKDGWPAVASDIYYEGPDLYCANCNAVIESSYGDPWANDNQD